MGNSKNKDISSLLDLDEVKSIMEFKAKMLIGHEYIVKMEIKKNIYTNKTKTKWISPQAYFLSAETLYIYTINEITKKEINPANKNKEDKFSFDISLSPIKFKAKSGKKENITLYHVLNIILQPQNKEYLTSDTVKKIKEFLKPYEIQNNFYNVPTSPASNLVLETLGAGKALADLPERKRQINHNTKYEILKSGNRRLISLENMTGTAEVTIELADIEKITGSNKPAKKLFVLSLIKANEQAIHNGQLTKDYISFPLQELVDIGFYKSLRSARTGFNTGADIITSLKIKGKIKKSKKTGVKIDTLEVLFTGTRIEKGQCYVFFNPRINWGFLTQYFTILPLYYFRLPNRASDLLYYIFFLARQHTKDIARKGYFTISFRAIQHKLQLPNEIGLNNPQRDIKDAIEGAIEHLEVEHSKTYGNMEFSLLTVYDEDASISEYLDNGYLKVGLKGTFASAFTSISKNKDKQIAKEYKRQARINEKS